ncbi:uncharacterized protein TrAtP1_012905 [Trichoderma atroviride]|uniref:uncharacterized protein n=1 Tax=Hypocrea atroviridis TaxID=63577 RepID=UPI00332F230F|nr:hypothetical protein TrAtP1_012905 [Trichoderma atroviride]
MKSTQRNGAARVNAASWLAQPPIHGVKSRLLEVPQFPDARSKKSACDGGYLATPPAGCGIPQAFTRQLG